MLLAVKLTVWAIYFAYACLPLYIAYCWCSYWVEWRGSTWMECLF